MRTLKVTVTMMFLTLLLACGEKHHASKTIKKFIQDNTQNKDISIIETSEIIQTRFVTDSLFILMQKNGQNTHPFKNTVKYLSAKKPTSLSYMRVKYTVTDLNDKIDSLDHVFYLTETLDTVLAFKPH